MPFKDIDIFVQAAAAILQGHDPYAIPNLAVLYPLPFYLIFAPFVVLPPSIVHVVWTALQVVILVALLGRRALLSIFSMPVFVVVLFGQIDIIMLVLFELMRIGIGGGIALAILALKPQLVLLLTPWALWRWWSHERRQLWWFVAVLGILLVGSLLLQPDWPVHFLAHSSAEHFRPVISSSLWGLFSVLPWPWWLVCGALGSIALTIWCWRRNDIDWVIAIGLLISPFVYSYNLLPLLTILRERRWLIAFTLLSWFTFGIAAWQSNDRASALLTLMTLAFLARSESPSVLRGAILKRV